MIALQAFAYMLTRQGLLFFRASLSLFLVVSFLFATTAHALTCSDVFGTRPVTPAARIANAGSRVAAVTARAAAPIIAVKKAISIKPILEAFRKPVDFDAVKSEELKREFVEKLRRGESIDPQKLTTLNEKVAWVDANGAMQGARGDIFHLAQNFQNATPVQKRVLAKAFKDIDFSNKVTWRQADKLATRLYILTQFNPSQYGLLTLFKTKWDTGVSDLIRYRIGLSIARYGLVRGLEQQGFLRTQSTRDRIYRRAHLWTKPIDIAWSTSLSTMSLALPFASSVLPPGVSAIAIIPMLMGPRAPKILMRSKDLTPELNQKLIDQGFEQVRAEVYKNYGTTANIQRGLNIAERTLGFAMLPIAAYFLFDDIKFVSTLAYNQFLPNDPLHLFDKERAEAEEQKIKLTPQQRKQLVEQLYESDRQTRIAARDPYPLPEADWEREERISAVDQELREADHLGRLNTLSDDELYHISQGGSVGSMDMQ